MTIYNFARFEPKPGMEAQLFAALGEILEPTQAEDGCVFVHLFESLAAPRVFMIHSQWKDEAAFAAHTEMAHMMSFLGKVGDMLAQPLQAVRMTKVQ